MQHRFVMTNLTIVTLILIALKLKILSAAQCLLCIQDFRWAHRQLFEIENIVLYYYDYCIELFLWFEILLVRHNLIKLPIKEGIQIRSKLVLEAGGDTKKFFKLYGKYQTLLPSAVIFTPARIGFINLTAAHLTTGLKASIKSCV